MSAAKAALLAAGVFLLVALLQGGLGDKAAPSLPTNARDCIAQGHYWSSNDLYEGYCQGAPPHQP